MVIEVICNLMDGYCFYFLAFYRWLGFNTESPEFNLVIVLITAGAYLVTLITGRLLEQADNGCLDKD